MTASPKKSVAKKPAVGHITGIDCVGLVVLASDVAAVGHNATITRDAASGEIIGIRNKPDGWFSYIDLAVLPIEKNRTVGTGTEPDPDD